MRSRPAQSGSRGRKSKGGKKGKGGDKNSKPSQFQLNAFQKRALAKLYMVGVRKVMGEAEEAGQEMTNERLTEFGDVTATHACKEHSPLHRKELCTLQCWI